jgi:hypothetical protein
MTLDDFRSKTVDTLVDEEAWVAALHLVHNPFLALLVAYIGSPCW